MRRLGLALLLVLGLTAPAAAQFSGGGSGSGSGTTPGGSGTQLQYRIDGSTLGGIPGTSFSGDRVTFESITATGTAIPEYDAGNSGASITPNWNNGARQSITLNNASVTIGTPTNPDNGADYTLRLIQDGTGGRLVGSWPTITWLGCASPPCAAPTLSTTAGASDFCHLKYIGTTYFGTCTTTVVPVLSVALGGTGLASGTSGGVLAFTAAGTLASSGALTANLPVIGGGAGVAPGVGTRSGNTTAFVTTTGTQTSGRCVEIDANGNHIAAAAACGTGGGINPATTLEIYDDFAAGAAASGSWGAAGWGSTASTNFTAQISAESGRHGILKIATGGSAQATPAAASSLSTNTVNGAIHFAGNFDITVSLRLIDNDSNTEAVMGLASAVGDTQPVSGALIRKTAAGTTWNGVIRTGDSEGTSATASLGTTGTNTWVKLRMFRVDSTTVGYQVDGGSIQCITSAGSVPGGCAGGTTSITMPSGALHFVIALWNNNAASNQDLDLDYIWLKVTDLSR